MTLSEVMRFQFKPEESAEFYQKSLFLQVYIELYLPEAPKLALSWLCVGLLQVVVQYWLDDRKKDGWLNLDDLERMTLENLHDPYRAPVCEEGSVPRFVLIQQLMGNSIVIGDIFDLCGNVVSKQSQ